MKVQLAEGIGSILLSSNQESTGAVGPEVAATSAIRRRLCGGHCAWEEVTPQWVPSGSERSDASRNAVTAIKSCSLLNRRWHFNKYVHLLPDVDRVGPGGDLVENL